MTFSVGFEDPSWDETALAAETAAVFRTDHHVVVARPEEFESLLKSLIWYHDEPLSHPNSVPLYVLSKFAHQYVTVVLTGEGSDELFGGYPRYQIARLRGTLDSIPGIGLRVLGKMISRLPGHRWTKLGSLLPLPLEESIVFNSAFVDPLLVERLVGCPISDVLSSRRQLLQENLIPGDATSTISRYEMSSYLACLLDRMDRMSMAHGLESRVPFLDVPLVEWALRLRSSLKVQGRQNKPVVRRLAERRLSPKVAQSAKSGFGVPLGDWFRDSAFRDLRMRLADREHQAAEHFDYSVLARILEQHERRVADHGELLWLLGNVYLWYEVHAMTRTSPPLADIGAPR